MNTAHPSDWYVLGQSHRQTAPALPAGSPLTARLVLAAYCTLAPPIRGDIRAGRNSRRVGIAFTQLDSISPAPLGLSRRERGRGIDYLVQLNARVGGVL